MNTKVSFIIKPFALGLGALVFTFMVMMGTSPLITAIFSAVLYFLLGMWIGRIHPQSLWYAPLLLNIFIWVVFIPMGMEFGPPIIRIWQFLIPPLVALSAAYVGTYTGFISIGGKTLPQNVTRISIVKKEFPFPQLNNLLSYLFLFAIGFAGMFICHFLLFLFSFFLAFSMGVSYTFSYLIVYSTLAMLQGARHSQLLLVRILFLCLAPSLYWFFLLWSDGMLSLNKISFSDSTSMIVIMPLTFAFSCIAAYSASWFKKPRTV